MLGADVLVLEPCGLGFGEVGDELHPRRQAWLRPAMRLWNLREKIANLARDDLGVDVHFPQQLGDDALRLLDQGREQMLGLDLSVVVSLGKLLGADDGFLRLFGVFVDVHFYFLPGPHPRSQMPRPSSPRATAPL